MSESLLTILHEVRQRIESVEDDRFRHALMYQYLIGGNVSEVAGSYAPLSSDMHQIEYNIRGRIIPAVMFIVKTIKRPNFYRACILPLDQVYDPWVEKLRSWFIEHDGCPFILGKNPNMKLNSNDRYLINKASKVFEGLTWLKGGYITSDHQRERGNVNFTSGQLRDLRHDVLKKLYSFNELDLAYFGAWNDPVVDERVMEELEIISKSSPSKTEVIKFKNIGATYFEKLLIRYEDLDKIPRELTYKDHIELESRFKKASRIIRLIRQINTVSELKLDTPLFQESMELVLDILNECDNEDSLQSNITEVMKLFEISYTSIKNHVSDPKCKRSIRLLRDYFDEHDISYNKSMFETWIHMGLLRNYFDHERDASKLRAVLEYYEEPFRMPDASNLWNKILDKFEDSLVELKKILYEPWQPISGEKPLEKIIIGDPIFNTMILIDQTLARITKIELGVEELNKQIRDTRN